MMHRFPSGMAGEKVHQKRVPHGAPLAFAREVERRAPDLGDLHRGMDDSAYSPDTLLEWAERDRLD